MFGAIMLLAIAFGSGVLVGGAVTYAACARTLRRVRGQVDEPTGKRTWQGTCVACGRFDCPHLRPEASK